jgi:antiviral helicase SKI2
VRSNTGGGDRSQWLPLVNYLKKRELLPCVVFFFSKRRCDAASDSLRNLDLTTSEEKREVNAFCERSISRLSPADRRLPQITRVRDLLLRGVGVHHAGLLPIVKEVVEMLFCRGLTKLLFCTETFAMGVNAPAKAVVFQSLRKHDGTSFRSLLPGEYTQMAGRAGRRGLDTVGTVIINCEDGGAGGPRRGPGAGPELPAESDLRRLTTGKAARLESKFRLTYNMILNLLRVEDLRVEDMIRRSFAEFHAQRALPDQQKLLAAAQAKVAELAQAPWPECYAGCTREEVEEYADLAATCEDLTAALAPRLPAALAFAPGRVVLCWPRAGAGAEVAAVAAGSPTARPPPALALAVRHSAAEEGRFGRPGRPERVTLMILRPPGSSMPPSAALPSSGGGGGRGGDPPGMAARRGRGLDIEDEFGGLRLAGGRGGGGRGGGRGSSAPAREAALPLWGDAWVLCEVPTAEVLGLFTHVAAIDATGALAGSEKALHAAGAALAAARDGGGLEGADPVKDLRVAGMDDVEAYAERAAALGQLQASRCHNCVGLPAQFQQADARLRVRREIARLRHSMSDAALQQMPDYQLRITVLEDLGYINPAHTVQLKGRVACEVQSGDELVTTELIFAGLLDDLDSAEAAALLSALVFQEKSDADLRLTGGLEQARDALTSLAWGLGEAQAAAGLPIAPDEYVKSALNFGLMEVVYEWAKGTPFRDICMLTDVMEGSIVRSISRLEETLREVRDAARVMGSARLFQQMKEASEAIKRDVIFAASLYVA